MNRPRRPAPPPRRRPTPAPSTTGQPQAPRRRSPLDFPPPVEPRWQVLGLADRQALTAAAQPLEMVVIQGYTREVEEAFGKGNVRPDDFWARNPGLVETARKLDQLFASIQARLGR